MSDHSTPSTQDDPVQNFVDELYAAFRSKQCQRTGSTPIAALTLDQAYEVQSRILERRIEQGDTPVGYKVGCTSRAIREQFGLEEPVMARLMAPYVYFGNTQLSWSDYVNCSVEPEFVFRIGQDITAEFLESTSLIEAIEYISPGIEVHNYKFWYGEPTSQELIASNAIHACVVIGDEKRSPEGLDLEMEGVALFIGNELVASGIGAEVMGGPLRSLAWLAKKLIARGECLRAGDLIIPGSPVRLVPVEKGVVVKARFTHCGGVQAEFV